MSQPSVTFQSPIELNIIKKLVSSMLNYGL